MELYLKRGRPKSRGDAYTINKSHRPSANVRPRPNQTPTSWALARLAAVIMKPSGAARKVDMSIWNKYKI